MHKITILLAGMCLGIACSTLPDAVSPLRKFNSRRYRPAQDFEAENPVGKLAFRYCVKEKFWGKGCKRWHSKIEDFCDEKSFKKFRDAGFIMVSEQRFN